MFVVFVVIHFSEVRVSEDRGQGLDDAQSLCREIHRAARGRKSNVVGNVSTALDSMAEVGELT